MSITKHTVAKNDPRFKLDALLSELSSSNPPIEIEDSGATVAVVLSIEEYRELRWKRAWKAIDEWRRDNADLDPDEVFREITAIVEDVRRENYDKGVDTKSRS